MMRLTISAVGAEVFDKSLSRLAGTIDDWRDAWPAIEDVLLHETERQFDSEGQYGSGGWPAISDGWLTYKQNHDLDTRVGHATLALRHSLTLKDGRDRVRVAAPGAFLFGTSVPYAEEFSKRRPAVQMPASGRELVARTLQRHAFEVARA